MSKVMYLVCANADQGEGNIIFQKIFVYILYEWFLILNSSKKSLMLQTPHQEIRWNYGVLRSARLLLSINDFKVHVCNLVTEFFRGC